MVEIRIQVTLPKQKFADKKWVDAIVNVLERKTAPKLKEYFRDTVYGWSAAKKPSFRQKLTRSHQSLSMLVYTDSEIYALVNEGSPRHYITPRGPYPMRFRKGYRPSTTPGVMKSRRAYRSKPWWTARLVDHPGFEARNFDELIAQTYEPQFIEDIQDAVNGAAVGHTLF